MSLGLLLFLAILVIVVITLLFLLATKKGYDYQHTVDEAPSTSKKGKNKL